MFLFRFSFLKISASKKTFNAFAPVLQTLYVLLTHVPIYLPNKGIVKLLKRTIMLKVSPLTIWSPVRIPAFEVRRLIQKQWNT